ncbi:MAG TPA: DUF6263 family protein [Chitinophagaceae bacterium]|nr:DUF6263 family protein [Chitinophagaceae bacterium]
MKHLNTSALRKTVTVFLVAALVFSCKVGPNPDKQYETLDGKNTYKLELNPEPGSVYHYDIVNETGTKVETGEKKLKSLNNTEAGITYTISKDSSGNLVLKMVFDKIHVYSKSGDKEKDIDADRSAFSTDPQEKMLGALKGTTLETIMNASGETSSISGFKELGDKIMAGYSNADIGMKNILQARLEQLVGDRMIKNSITQLFKIFPDSAVHTGDKWKINADQAGEFNLHIRSFFQLKEVHDDISVIASQGDISSDSTMINVEGLGQVLSNLHGKQEGEYKMETKTGMLLEARITAKVEGNIQFMGRQMPVIMKVSVKIDGKKMN